MSTIYGTTGDDWLVGTPGDDVIDGDVGNDDLIGMEGSDTYVFGQGSGNDMIHNYEPESNLSIDRIQLKTGVNPQDVELKLVMLDSQGNPIPASLLLTLRSTGETLLVLAQFESFGSPTNASAIDFIEFANGTVWDQAEIERRAYPTNPIEGTPGDDYLAGTPGNDVIDGGTGNDYLMGQEGSDTYVFGQGSGNDTIDNYEPEWNQSVDRIQLKGGVTVDDVELKVVMQDALQLRLRSTGETLLVYGQFGSPVVGSNSSAIDFIEFADGTLWNKAEIDRRAHLIEGTPGDDYLLGTQGNDVIDGGAGNDTLVGMEGSDTYVFGQGSGNDRIYNEEPELNQSVDRIQLSASVSVQDVELKVVTQDNYGGSIPASLQLRLRSTGETLLVWRQFDSYAGTANSAAIDLIEFADGSVWDKTEIERRAHLIEGTAGDDYLVGTTGNDVLDGGAGNDQLMGDLGSDTYLFGVGSGNDRIYNYEPDYAQSPDRILLKPEVSVADVELKLVTQDINGGWVPPSLQLRLRSTGETLLVFGQFDPNAPAGMGIDSIEFADGSVWDKTEIERRAHLIEGTAGDDYLVGTTGNDVLDGGAGNDVLVGQEGSDTYVFGQGYGNDQISNHEPEWNQSIDRIQLKAGVTQQDVELKVAPQEIAYGYSIPIALLLTLRSTGETLLVRDQFAIPTDGTTNSSAIDFIEFADGTVWDKTEIERRAHLFEGTPGDDTLVGASGNDVFDGGAGNDLLVGQEGSDTYVFGQGSGNDTIDNYEPEWNQSIDRIQLKAGVNVEDVELKVVTRDANGLSIPVNLLLTLRGTGETLLVRDQFESYGSNITSSAIDFIEFADGTVWDKAEIERRTSRLIEGTPGDEVLLGTMHDDVFDGGAGNDTLVGQEGSDTYVFGQGSGNDTIYNYEPEANQSIDRIQLKAGISQQDVELNVVTQDANGINIPASLQLRLRSTGETLLVTQQFESFGAPTNPFSIDFIEFADGTVWDKAEIEYRSTRLIEGTPGDDYLGGTSGNDVFDGGAGNDWLVGGEGRDTYVFGQGSGNDQINNYEPEYNQSVDRIQLKAGVSVQDVELKVVAEYTLQLTLRSTGETLQVPAQFMYYPDGTNTWAVDFIEFPDGTVWDKVEIERRAHLFEGTPGDDYLVGTTGNDVFDAGAGNDVLVGRDGSDTYVFGQGSGNDQIFNAEPEFNQSIDRIQLKPGVSVEDVELKLVTHDNNGNSILDSLQLRLRSTGETLLVSGQFSVNYGGGNVEAIDYIEFSDGTVWDKAEIERRVHLIEGTGGDDFLVGTSGADVVTGGAGNDVLDGAAGNDALIGGEGNNVYLFGRGDGVDVVNNFHQTSGPNGSVIQLKPGVAKSDVAFARAGDDLDLTINGTTDKLTVQNFFAPADSRDQWSIQQINFDGDTPWTSEMLYRQYDGVNEAPTVAEPFADQPATEDSPFAFAVPAQAFADMDAGDALTLSASLANGEPLPSWLAFDAAGRVFSGTPQNADVGAIVVRVSATDAAGLRVSSDFTLSVANVNDAPTLSGTPVALAAGSEDTAYTITLASLLQGFSDLDGDSLSVQNLSASHGSLSAFDAVSASWTFTPDANYNGAVNLSYDVSDGTASVAASQSLNLAAVNDAPTLSGVPAARAAGTEDTAYTITLASLLQGFSDLDGDSLSVQNLSASHGSLSAFDAISASWTFTPDANYNGAVNLSYDVSDGTASVAASQSLSLAAVNDAPTLSGTQAALAAGSEDTVYTIMLASLLQGFSDLDGDNLIVQSLSASHGSLSAFDEVSASWTFTPDANYNGAVNLSYEVSDGTASVAASQSLNLAAVNDAPTGAVVIAGTATQNQTLTASNTLGDLDGLGTIGYQWMADGVAIAGATAGTLVLSAAQVGKVISVAASYTDGQGTDERVASTATDLVGAAPNNFVGTSGSDTLSGTSGADQFFGFAGNDTYVVNNTGDVVVEDINEGTDLVNASVTYTLAANVENLTLTGTSTINGTGNAADNVLTGNSAANVLTGGAGNDTYIVGTGDTTIEAAGAGIDTVQSAITWTLATHVENLTLTGTNAINGTGNASDNVLLGNTRNNTLTGNAGNDTLDGGAGADTLVGGTDNDTYILGRGYGADKVQENDSTAGNTDVLQFLSGIATDQLWFRQVNNSLEVSVIGTTDKATVSNWYLGSQYHVEQFKTNDGKTLLDSQVQNLVQAMAAFSPPAAGQTTLPPSYAATLDPVIAANWQ